jgi:multidrug resistance efflux pump
MEALLVGIYAFFVWLIFIKFKWLPWNITSQVIVVTIPIVGLTVLILTLNVVAPSSADVRVIKYVVNVIPQVRGRVIEVPVEPNRPVKKGDVLFRIDPTPYQLQVNVLEAQLVNAQGSSNKLGKELEAAVGRTQALRSNLALARKRVTENKELVAAGAGDRFALEQAETSVQQLESDLASALANEGQVRAMINATVGEDQAEVAQIRAQLENAKWELQQTTVFAPADGYAINVQLRPGAMTAAFPALPVMTFVENEYQVIALFQQNELHAIEPGNEAEFTITTSPGTIVKAKVDSIIWAQAQGQVMAGLQLPQTGSMPQPEGRFAVKLTVDPKQAGLFFPAGAMGHGAIYTNHAEAIQILRKVILRIGAKVDYLILKLH